MELSRASQAGLVYASEVRQGDRSLNGKEPGGPGSSFKSVLSAFLDVSR